MSKCVAEQKLDPMNRSLEQYTYLRECDFKHKNKPEYLTQRM